MDPTCSYVGRIRSAICSHIPLCNISESRGEVYPANWFCPAVHLFCCVLSAAEPTGAVTSSKLKLWDRCASCEPERRWEYQTPLIKPLLLSWGVWGGGGGVAQYRPVRWTEWRPLCHLRCSLIGVHKSQSGANTMVRAASTYLDSRAIELLWRSQPPTPKDPIAPPVATD